MVSSHMQVPFMFDLILRCDDVLLLQISQSSIFWRSDKNALIAEIRGAAGNGDAARLAQLLRKAKVKYLNEGDEVSCTTFIACLLRTVQFKETELFGAF